MHNSKSLPASVKAIEETEGAGIVEALVATYDVDSGGDRIVPGAFTKSLEEWRESGTLIPFIWSHQHSDLDAYIGDVLEAEETDEGLRVRAQLDMEDEKARKAFRLIKGGRIRNYSFAYEVLDEEPDEAGGGETALKELRIFEVGPTLIGMNQNTRTLAAKNHSDESPVVDTDSRPDVGEKAGRVLSAKNESDLREAATLIANVLKQLDSEPEKQTSDSGPVTDKEPNGATSKEPSRQAPVRRLAAELSLITLGGGDR